MTRVAAIAATLLALAIAGCGSNSSNDSGDQVRAAVRQLVDDAHAHRWGDYCAASTNPDKCEAAIASATAIGVDAAQFVPSADVLDNMRVTITGDHATVDSTAGKDAEWVRHGDRWLWVWTSS